MEPLLVLNFLSYPYDCIFKDFIETEFLKKQSIKLWVWKRFNDDVFFIWTGSEENLEKFLKELHGCHHNIKFTFEKLEMKVNFLDVVTEIKNGRLSTDRSYKLVDSYQYLQYNYCHEQHKNIIIYSQTLRLRKICSEKKGLKIHAEDLKGWFLRRCYPQRLAKEQVGRALRLPLEHDTQKTKNANGIPLAVTYNPPFKNLSTTLQKNFNILFLDAENRTVFTSRPFFAYRKAQDF